MKNRIHSFLMRLGCAWVIVGAGLLAVHNPAIANVATRAAQVVGGGNDGEWAKDSMRAIWDGGLNQIGDLAPAKYVVDALGIRSSTVNSVNVVIWAAIALAGLCFVLATLIGKHRVKEEYDFDYDHP